MHLVPRERGVKMKNSPIKINYTELECEGKTYHVDMRYIQAALYLCEQAKDVPGAVPYFLQENSNPEFKQPIEILAQTRDFINFITEGKIKCDIRECPPVLMATARQGS